MSSEPWFSDLRHTAEAQRHSAGDVHGVSVKPSQLLALLDEVEESRRVIALCAADTTAADLAQDIEFLKAERDHRLERLLDIAEHLFQMVPREVWRDSGGDDGQGHYEGDYRAEKLYEELAALRAAHSQAEPK
jgi:hypothetical protein